MTDKVTLEFAADTENVSLARSLAAAMAARADFTLDRVEDARLAVDEAVAQVIDSGSTGRVSCVFELDDGWLTMTVTGPYAAVPARDTFGWTVLRTLVNDVDARATDDALTIVLRMAGRVPAGA